MNNEKRLIDANALKYKNLAEVNGRLTYVLTPEEINSAPIEKVDNYARGYQDGIRTVLAERPGWIPITYRLMTEEEEKERCAKLGVEDGSLEDWEKRIFTCQLPDDGQEILISWCRYVKEDTCVWDEYGCGLEDNGDWDGVDAWMPKPEPYDPEGGSTK